MFLILELTDGYLWWLLFGFDIKPEITFSSITSTTTGCIPNIELSITSDPLNNSFQWVYNGQDIPGAISNTYTPNLSERGPGYYKVKNSLWN
jgi:hypothetical protein